MLIRMLIPAYWDMMLIPATLPAHQRTSAATHQRTIPRRFRGSKCDICVYIPV